MTSSWLPRVRDVRRHPKTPQRLWQSWTGCFVGSVLYGRLKRHAVRGFVRSTSLEFTHEDDASFRHGTGGGCVNWPRNCYISHICTVIESLCTYRDTSAGYLCRLTSHCLSQGYIHGIYSSTCVEWSARSATSRVCEAQALPRGIFWGIEARNSSTSVRLSNQSLRDLRLWRYLVSSEVRCLHPSHPNSPSTSMWRTLDMLALLALTWRLYLRVLGWLKVLYHSLSISVDHIQAVSSRAPAAQPVLFRPRVWPAC